MFVYDYSFFLHCFFFPCLSHLHDSTPRTSPLTRPDNAGATCGHEVCWKQWRDAGTNVAGSCTRCLGDVGTCVAESYNQNCSNQ